MTAGTAAVTTRPAGPADPAAAWLIAEYELDAAVLRKCRTDPWPLTAADRLRLRRLRDGTRKPRAARRPMAALFGGPGIPPERGACR